MPEPAPSADVHIDPKFAPNAAWLLWHAQARRPLHPAIQDGPRQTTYAELGAAAQPFRRARRLLLAGVDPGVRRHRDEHDTDGEKALVEVRGAVEAPVQGSFKNNRHQGSRDERYWQ